MLRSVCFKMIVVGVSVLYLMNESYLYLTISKLAFSYVPMRGKKLLRKILKIQAEKLLLLDKRGVKREMLNV